MIDKSTKIVSLQDTDVPWPCYKSRNTNLVCFIHRKCASALYDALFLKLNWMLSDTQQIDWDNNIVFSYIKNPKIKHLKGLTEGVFSFFPEMKEALSTPDGLRFLANVTSIEPHSYTIYRMLGNNSLNMTWIPVDTDLDHKEYTFDFFEQHGEPFLQEDKNWFLSLKKQNESTVEELDFFDKLSAQSTPPEIIRYIDFDQCLYDAITKPSGFEPNNYSDRIQQLLKSGISQSAAEIIADKEVLSTAYLNWKFT